MVLARVRAGVIGLLMVLSASVASAQAPVLTASVDGLTVNLAWTAVPQATGYLLEVQPPSGPQFSAPVNNVTSLSLPGIPPGTYLARVRGTAGQIQGPPSEIVTISVVGTPPPPPPAPTNLTAAVSGQDVLFSWSLPSAAGISALAIQAGTTPGGTDVGTFPVRPSLSSYLPGAPVGTFYVRMFSVGAGGFSAPSNEIVVTTPGCVAPTSLPLSASSQGSLVNIEWGQIPGAVGYRLDVSSVPGGAPDVLSTPIAAHESSISTFGVATGTYYLTLHSQTGCGGALKSAEVALNVTAPVRLPAKSFNQATGLVLAAVGSTGGIGSSCGNNTWLFRVLQQLRSVDDRFGLNWKRGNVGDMSQDVIIYNFSDLPNEQAGAAQVYAWDVIGSHCGPRPYPQAANITNARGSAGWTILYYLRAGFTP